jgi:predicted transcriptional regulator
MAYREETDKQFFESIYRQANRQPGINNSIEDNPVDNPQAEIHNINREIKQVEAQLHELQAKKIELMKKITGRL